METLTMLIGSAICLTIFVLTAYKLAKLINDENN
jgi:hypothetical protein